MDLRDVNECTTTTGGRASLLWAACCYYSTIFPSILHPGSFLLDHMAISQPTTFPFPLPVVVVPCVTPSDLQTCNLCPAHRPVGSRTSCNHVHKLAWSDLCLICPPQNQSQRTCLSFPTLPVLLNVLMPAESTCVKTQQL